MNQFFTTAYLVLLISLGYFAADIYLPSLPALSTYFHADDHEVKMTLMTYLLSFSLFPIIFGPLSDHIGRKKVILGGIFIGIIATFGCLFSTSIEMLSAYRFIQGLGMSAVLISSRAITSDLFTGKTLAKQISIVTMLMPFVLAIAPTVGGFLQENFDWQAVFIFLICYLIFVFICVLFHDEPLKTKSNRKISQIFTTYYTHLQNRRFLISTINFILPSLGIFAYLTLSPFLFQEIIGLSPIEYGTLAIYIGATIAITGYLNLKLIHYFSAVQILYLGSSLMTLAGSLLLYVYFLDILTTWSLLIPTLIFFTSMPLCVSNAASKAMNAISEYFGAATALLTTFQFIMGALSSFICSLCSNETVLPLGMIFIFAGVASIINLKRLKSA